MEEHETLLADILDVCDPKRVILYAEKRIMSTQKLKSVSICVIIDDADTKQLRKKLYLAISIDVPVSLSIYTSEQWRALQKNRTSYASFIARKGQVIYESTT